MSRLGRDYLKVGFYTEVLLVEKGVRFIAINNGIDSANQTDSDFTPFLNIINEWYAKDTSKKIRAVMKSKGEADEHLCTNPPYGYMKDPDNKKRWIVDEAAAEVVKRIFTLCLEGFGPPQIARILKEDKVITPTIHFQQTGRATRNTPPDNPYHWTGDTVADILERPEYQGHTVNFKTYKQSYKSKKTCYNPKEKQLVFENTHEAIIDKETFEIVQKIRSGKRRPTKMGDMPMFSGLLYCADCGSKMTFHRQMAQSAEKHNFVCSNYRHNSKSCTMHYIRNVVVEQIVLENLKEVIRYVSDYEDEFVQMVMDTDMRQRNKELLQKKKRLTEIHSRIQELDKIFQRIYEDNISGKLSDERFMKLSRGYEEEQHTLQEEQTSLEKELQKEEKQSVDVKQFLSVVRKYTNLTELTPEIVHEFIDKIIVHAPDKSSGKRLQEIEIIYNHIGVFDHSKVTLWKGKAV